MSIKKWIIPCLLAVFALALFVGHSNASISTDYLNQVAKTLGTPTRTQLNINSLAYWIYSDGTSAHNPNTGGNGIYFPRGTYGAGVIYEEGMLWGGMVQDGQQPELRVGGSTYKTGLIRGKILSKGVSEDIDASDVRIWRIRADYETADLRQDAAEMVEAGINDMSDADVEDLREQYATDWEEWPWEKGAPFYDENGNGIMDGDEKPGLADADQVIWFVANDLNEGRTLGLYGSPPIGMEVQITMWGYNRTDALGSVAFKKYKVIYKGTSDTPNDATVDSMYFAVWNDPDLGEAGDDLVGCDTTLNMMYVYNSVTLDAKFVSFNLAPPAAGYDFLQGPIVETGDPADEAIFGGKIITGYTNLGMTKFNYFAAGSAVGDPDLEVYAGTTQWYNLMNGLLPRAATTFTDNAGTPTAYPLSGDPVTKTGDNDGVLLPAGDRRAQMITGPITMAMGDTQEVVIAFVAGLGSDRLSSISVMKFNDVSAQYAYDNFFELAKPPSAPILKVTNLDQKVLLNWSSDSAAVMATEEIVQKGYAFEGYNVYVLPSPSSPLSMGKKIATFDVINEITTIKDASFDESSGQILELPVQLGLNSGLRRSYLIEEDYLKGGNLVNGTSYYFAVTAYSYNGDGSVPIHSLECSPLIKQAVPQSRNPGERLPHVDGDTLAVSHEGPSDGSVVAIVFDPTKTTGNTYHVTFQQDEEGAVTWSLIDSTLDEVLLAGQTNQVNDDENLIVDGLLLKVSGPAPGLKWVYETDADYNIVDDGVSIVEFSLGSTGYILSNREGDYNLPPYARDFDRFGTWGMDDFEFDFTTESLVWQYTTEAIMPVKAPFALWRHNFATGEKERMYPMIFDEGFGDSLEVDGYGAWDTTGVDVLFGKPAYEPIYGCISTDGNYDPALEADYIAAGALYLPPTNTGWGGPANPHYYPTVTATVFVDYLGGGPPIGNKIMMTTNKPNSSKDTYSFDSAAPTYSDLTAKADVEKINVYPNPYYGMNPREQTAVNRFVSFNHLPPQATFRIFDLAGNLVTKIDKDDETQFTQWDLRNHNGLPVASGIYIIHIDMPDLGKVKILKLAVVREAEFIEIY
ncbi:T9SS type A sorting domain-containing protein [candidate division KSB1 bacterium]|nr:T9SS type A sorting domain-containing protein [candidate division KSB1 bacterium]